MTRHLDFSVQAFVNNVPIDLMERFLDQLKIEHVHRDWLHCNAPALEHYLSDPTHAETGGLIRAELQRLNDISHEVVGILHSAFHKYQIAYDGDLPREQLALLLFLDHPTAFDYAWSRYLLLDSTATVSVYALLTAEPAFGTQQCLAFQEQARAWFAEQAKGEYCNADCFSDDAGTIIRVQRGTYVQTRQYWDGPRVGTDSRRPAVEDILVFEPDTKLLRIKAGHERDREQYLRFFCEHIAGDRSLAELALKTPVFDLGPIQRDTFDYGGDGPIARIELRRVKLRLFGPTNTVIDLKAEDVRAALRSDVRGLSLESGALLSARLRFLLALSGQRRRTITVLIEPPLHTNLHERRFADRVFSYLQREGVKLR